MSDKKRQDAWIIVTDTEYQRIDAFGYSYRFVAMNHVDNRAKVFLPKMEELGYKVPRMAKFPFVITFGDKPTVSGCGLVILKINLAKPHTLSHVAFVEIDDWTKIMTSEEDEGVEIIKRPDEVDDNLVGLTIEIAADEVIEVIKI